MSLSADEIRARLAAKTTPVHTPPLRSLSQPAPSPDVKQNGKSEDNQPAAFHEEHRCQAEPPLREPPPPTARRDRGSSAKTASNSSSPVLLRLPPHSLEAEMGVLGSMLLSPKEVIAEVVAQVDETYFYTPAHRIIFSAMVKLWDSGQAVDLITFTQHLRDVGQLEEVGGPSAVTALITFVPTSANVTYYVDIVRDKFLLRELITASTESVRRAYEEQDEVGSLLDEAEQKIFSIGDNRFKGDIQSMKENVVRAIETMTEAYERKGGVTGVATNFIEFDRMTGGLQKSEMIVIAARPSMGKTALCMNIAEHVACSQGLAVAVFSLEMSVDQLTQRMLCSRARVNLQKVRDGFMGERDFPSLTAAASKLAEAKIFIDDSSGISILELRAKARRLKAQHDIALVVVDYLQLLRSNTRKSQDSRQIEISEISAGLKGLAKELRIPVLVAAQLNRQPEARQGGKPRLSDLRESGSIEQDADTVGLLVRPEVYQDDLDLRAEMAGEAELIIAKQRNGPIGEISLTFIKEYTRFEDRAKSVPVDNSEEYYWQK